MKEFCFEDLVRAYFDCRKHKRNTLNALDFEIDLENNLIKLYNELKDETYEIGKSICFMVLNPKPREVWAATFRDRIVHHLVYNAIKDRFYNRFIVDTYSCIPERGTLNAVRKVKKYAQAVTCNYSKDAYYLKADLRNFFVSIDKEILMQKLKCYVEEEWILKLLHKIVYHDPRSNYELRSAESLFRLLPSCKSLWHTPLSKGLPIGNLTSQFFSNVYLNVLDQYVKHHLKCKYYCRYVDDFIMLDENPRRLNSWHKDLTVFLKEKLRLDLHQNKRELNKISRGIDFVGYVIKPKHMLPRQKTIKRVFKVMKEYKKSTTWFSQFEINSHRATINSYLGLFRHINSYNLRRKMCIKSINLFVGCDDEYTKIFCRFDNP